MDDYKDIIESQHHYAQVSKCMKKLCKICNMDYIDYSLKEKGHPKHAFHIANDLQA